MLKAPGYREPLNMSLWEEPDGSLFGFPYERDLGIVAQNMGQVDDDTDLIPFAVGKTSRIGTVRVKIRILYQFIKVFFRFVFEIGY